MLRQTHILEDWVDCRGVSTVPCLKVTVNMTGSTQGAFLHYDEESVLLAKEVGTYSSFIIYSLTLANILGGPADLDLK